MLRLRPHLGSSQFPFYGNVRVNILVAKRGAYGLKSSVRRDHMHINRYVCLYADAAIPLIVQHACLLGAMMCFMDTPVRMLS